jgi:hypothetical protein
LVDEVDLNLIKNLVRNAQALAVVNSVRGLLMLRPHAQDVWLLEPMPEGFDCDSVFRPIMHHACITQFLTVVRPDHLVVDHFIPSIGRTFKCKIVVGGRADSNPNWKRSFDAK